MATFERKYKSSITFGSLELSCEAHEQLHGEIKSLEIVGDYTIAAYDDDNYPAESTLGFMPAIGDEAPPTPSSATSLFVGEALIMGHGMKIAVFRTS